MMINKTDEKDTTSKRKRRLTKQERKAAKRLKRKRMEEMTPKTTTNVAENEKKKKKKTKKKKKKPKQIVKKVEFVPSSDVNDVIQTLSTRDGTLSDRLNHTHAHFDPELKSKWKTFSKRERAEIVKADQSLIRDKLELVKSIVHPFETKEEDHCESPIQAFEDIAPILRKLAKRLGKTPENLKIYDPYYCTGTVIEHFKKLGFNHVYNKCEDFYDVIARNKIPDHDVIVTNPPYTEWHVKKLLKFCRKNGKPFLLLLPNYFCKKDFYFEELDIGGKFEEPAYLAPRRGRYMYWTPKGLHRQLSKQNHVSKYGFRTSPFVSFWYIDLFPTLSKRDLLTWFSGNSKDLYESESKSPWLCRDSNGLPRNSRPVDVVN